MAGPAVRRNGNPRHEIGPQTLDGLVLQGWAVRWVRSYSSVGLTRDTAEGTPIMRSSMTKLLGALLGMAMLVAAGAALAEEAPGGTLDRIRQDKTIHIAYREDAPPFSYKNGLGEPAGFMVDLCKAVVEKLSEQLSLPLLSIAFVPVTALDRFEAIQQHKADLLCEPTSATLSRRELVDFSVATFVEGN